MANENESVIIDANNMEESVKQLHHLIINSMEVYQLFTTYTCKYMLFAVPQFVGKHQNYYEAIRTVCQEVYMYIKDLEENGIALSEELLDDERITKAIDTAADYYDVTNPSHISLLKAGGKILFRLYQDVGDDREALINIIEAMYENDKSQYTIDITLEPEPEYEPLSDKYLDDVFNKYKNITSPYVDFALEVYKAEQLSAFFHESKYTRNLALSMYLMGEFTANFTHGEYDIDLKKVLKGQSRAFKKAEKVFKSTQHNDAVEFYLTSYYEEALKFWALGFDAETKMLRSGITGSFFIKDESGVKIIEKPGYELMLSVFHKLVEIK